MGLYRVPARATITPMSANPSPLSSLTSPGGGVMPQGEEVASFATYPEAQRAVDALSDQGFPVQHLAIIGTDLRQVERITGRMSWGRAAMSGAMSGLWIGVFFGLIISVAGSNGPRLSFWVCVLLGVLWGIVFPALQLCPDARAARLHLDQPGRGLALLDHRRPGGP